MAACGASNASVAQMRTKPRRRVLVVDDHVQTAVALARLIGVLGHDASVVHDGHTALGTVESDAPTPDLILLDLGLPRMNGFTVARRLRANARLTAATLVAVSGYGTREDRLRALDAGFDQYLLKPVDIEALVTLLETPARPEFPA